MTETQGTPESSKLELHRRSFFCWVAGLFGVNIAAQLPKATLAENLLKSNSQLSHTRFGQHARMLRLIQSVTNTPPDTQKDYDYIEFWNAYERKNT